MDWAQASSEWANTVGVFSRYAVAPICTAAVALFAAKFLRSHDDKKERRRRRQDFLERVLEDLDGLQYDVNAALRIVIAIKALTDGAESRQIRETALQDLNRQLSESIKVIEIAVSKVARHESKFRLFRFEGCGAAFEDHILATTVLLGAILKSWGGHQQPDNFLERARFDWWEKKQILISKITDSFEQKP